MDKSTLKLTPKQLTPDAFTEFGDVISEASATEHFLINEDNTRRFHNLADIQVGEGKAITSIFAASPFQADRIIQLMECHPLGSQAFYPLHQQDYLVIVAPKGEFSPEKVECFHVAGNQGVNFHQGVWHHYCTTLNSPASFLVIDRKGEGNNLQEVFLRDYPTSLQVDLSGYNL